MSPDEKDTIPTLSLDDFDINSAFEDDDDPIEYDDDPAETAPEPVKPPSLDAATAEKGLPMPPELSGTRQSYMEALKVVKAPSNLRTRSGFNRTKPLRFPIVDMKVGDAFLVDHNPDSEMRRFLKYDLHKLRRMQEYSDRRYMMKEDPDNLDYYCVRIK